VDEQEKLRIVFITGVSKKNPSHYTVVISTNFNESASLQSFFVSVSRINKMTPDTSENLDLFLENYREIGRYVIAPAYMKTDIDTPEIHTDLVIEKRQLIVRPAWEIGEHDPDGMGISEDDDPIVPPDVKDAPILALLKRRRRSK
jgi:hypothetical protein